MKILKRIGLLVLFTFLGAFFCVILAMTISDGLFVQWKSLGKPTEKVVEVIRPGYVKTASGNIYHQNNRLDCSTNCWEIMDNLPTDHEPYWEMSSCGRMPSLKNYLDTKAVCQPGGTGSSLTIYALGKDGLVYSWNHSIGEGDSILLFYAPFAGSVVGFVIGVVVLLVGLYLDFLKWGRQQKNYFEQVNRIKVYKKD